jgi:hypothetical protein
VYPSTIRERLDWLERKTVETDKIVQEDFDLLKTHFILLLQAGIHKEDVFAIFNYLLIQDLDITQQLAVLKELSLSVARHDISSKTLRNFVSRNVKLARTRRMGPDTLTSFLLGELRSFEPEKKYKSTPYKLINTPTQK